MDDHCRRQQDTQEGALWCRTCWRYKTFGNRCPEFEPGGFRLYLKDGELTWHSYQPKADA